MTQTIRFCLCLHNHQPIGNFDGVFEQSYQDSYLPFLDLFEEFDDLLISLHTSGPLMEWLEASHPEYVQRVVNLVKAGRIEILGGAYYEPILVMIPSRDRVGQITAYTHWLEERLGTDVRGMWVPERVWEQNMTRDIATAGIKYTILDDFHFKNAGLREEQLHGYYLTEDEGHLLNIYPGSERLRYLIPFGDPEETIEYLGGIAERHQDAVVVFGDDGEKFGTWPDTNKHVYQDGWLRRFFEALQANSDWIKMTTLAEATENTRPVDRIYLPDAAYREMTEWALPTDRQIEYEDMVHDMENDERWPVVQTFIRGGFWRNFRAKYPEANEMYARMMMVSQALHEARIEGIKDSRLDDARTELYRGQCNCPYWHGAFGGIYLPHLRNAIFRHLIQAERLINQSVGRVGPRVEASVGDYNLDGRQEVLLGNDRALALIAPAVGGSIYELDVRTIGLNLAATMARRPEAYHRKVLAGENLDNDDCASIHDRVVFKQKDLDKRIYYDDHNRSSLIDHFYDNDATLGGIETGSAMERGDFADGIYEARLRRNPDRIQALLIRDGNAWGVPIRITKGVTVESGSNTLEIAYLLEGLPQDGTMHFAVELNLAGLPAGADDRFFHSGGQRKGHLGERLDLQDIHDIGLTDQWLGIDVRLETDRPSSIWTFPIETVSQSEGGFELVHQSTTVMPHWQVRGDAEGRWSVVMRLALDTTLAESRRQNNDSQIPCEV